MKHYPLLAPFAKWSKQWRDKKKRAKNRAAKKLQLKTMKTASKRKRGRQLRGYSVPEPAQANGKLTNPAAK